MTGNSETKWQQKEYKIVITIILLERKTVPLKPYLDGCSLNLGIPTRFGFLHSALESALEMLLYPEWPLRDLAGSESGKSLVL